mgnify:CR=1 FL=1
MTEIHKNTSQFVYLDVYGGTADDTPTAVLVNTYGVERILNVIQDTPPTGIDDRYHVVLTMADTNNEGDIEVQWLFEMDSVEVSKTDYISVVTPYLSLAEVKKVWPEATDDEARDVEAAVRHIINAHTGQQFGYGTKTLIVEGHGESALRLPERLDEITAFGTLTAELDTRAVIIVSDGWYIKKGWAGTLADIESDNAFWNGWEPTNDAAPGEPGYEKQDHGYIIHAPGVHSTPTKWRDDYPFRITGKWGYKTVPAPVKEAAKLLINDYACSEALYRDRYLESIKAADWRMQFSSRAWEYTGNVRADQLLSEYVLLDWAVV